MVRFSPIPQPVPYELTADDKALIRCMAYRKPTGGFSSYGVRTMELGNIAAVHFDGQVLVDMVRAHHQVGLLPRHRG